MHSTFGREENKDWEEHSSRSWTKPPHRVLESWLRPAYYLHGKVLSLNTKMLVTYSKTDLAWPRVVNHRTLNKRDAEVCHESWMLTGQGKQDANTKEILLQCSKNHPTPLFSHSSGTTHLKLSIQFAMPVLVSTRNRYNAKLRFGNDLSLALLTWVQSYADPPLLFSFFFSLKPLKKLEFMVLRCLRHTKSGLALQSWEYKLPTN